MGFLRETIRAYQKNDPAARSALEVFLLYNGLHATIYYRISHWLYRHHCHFLARWVSQHAKWTTGVEIHPAATIGRRLVIDHGTGIVIGATVEIGDDCLLYQCVTLGGTGISGGKRHPTLGNNVMVGSGAKILGPIQIGDHVRVAANAVVLQDVPANSTVVGVPGPGGPGQWGEAGPRPHPGSHCVGAPGAPAAYGATGITATKEGALNHVFVQFPQP